MLILSSCGALWATSAEPARTWEVGMHAATPSASSLAGVEVTEVVDRLRCIGWLKPLKFVAVKSRLALLGTITQYCVYLYAEYEAWGST